MKKAGIHMKKTVQRVISLLLAVVLVVGVFAGCGKANKEETAAITATAVKYAKSGQYTTTVSSKKVDLSGITADNVEVRYLDLTAVPEASSEAAQEADLEDVYSLCAKVESVKPTDKKSCEITFPDDKAAEYITDSYIVLFKGVEGDDNTASVEVEFPEITLTPDVENVVSDVTEAKITLAIDGGAFEDGISEEDIYLADAFSDMKIESVSSSDKNLTVQLTGSPVRNEAGAYQWGSVNVKPSGITDGYTDVTSKIAVRLANAGLDAATLKFENGKIIAALQAYGVVDMDTLTKDNIKLDGATVEAAEKTDDNTVMLTVAADGIQSVNDFADLIGGKTMTLGDYETQADISQAGFYPVFDYAEEDGDDLKITLKLYAGNGTFDKALKADAVSFADDFKDAKAESVTVDSDTVATLILSVPANGQTTETFKMNGTVTLAAGAFTNAWGDKTSKEVSYTRDYSGETLGKAVTLNVDTLLEIKKYTRGKNTTFGCILYWGGVAGKVYSIGKSILEAAGVLESDQARLLRELAGINAKLDQISQQIESLREEIKGLVVRDIQNKLSTYNSDMELLNKKIRDVSFVYDRARKDLAKTDEKYANIDWENMTDEEASAYNHVLIEYILSNAKPDNLVYSSFLDDCNTLKTKYESVTGMLERVDDSNPICLYDEACSCKYNFDSQAYAFRLAQRVYAQTTLIKAFAALAIRYDAGADPENPNAKAIILDYNNAMETLQAHDNIGHQASEIKAHPHYGEAADFNTYIGDIMVAGMATDHADTVKKLLTDKGYTVIDADLNESTNGSKIYLGYKTTKNKSEAIKGFFFDTADHDTVERDGKTYYKCPAAGDEAFVKRGGDLNHGVTYKLKVTSRSGTKESIHPADRIILYYTKDGDEQDSFTNICFDDNYSGSITDANGGTGAYSKYKSIYMHTDSVASSVSSHKLLENDPEYYPFSYVLGKKVSVWNSKEHSFMEKVDWRYAMLDRIDDVGCYRNWTDEEVNAFLGRMNGRSLKDELRSAGITSIDSLVTSMERAANLGIVLLWGNCINPQDSSVRTDQTIYMVGINNGSMIKNSEKQYMDYSLFELH